MPYLPGEYPPKLLPNPEMRNNLNVEIVLRISYARDY
jgi:hypothetical protein